MNGLNHTILKILNLVCQNIKIDYPAIPQNSNHPMRCLKLAILFIATVGFLAPSGVIAKDFETYRGDISVLILEKDTVLARNNAFQSLQNLLLSAAIQNLIGPDLYEEYKSEISRNSMLEASKFLVSAKVLNEYSDGERFFMELEGKIQISTLSDVLRGMNLVLKSDPWFPVTIVMDNSLNLSPQLLKSRLDLFHINITAMQPVDLEGISWQERSKADFIEALFQQFSGTSIIYFIDAVSEKESRVVKGIRNQVFRRSDLSLMDSFQLDIPVPKPAESLNETQLNRFLRLYSISSIDIDHYEEGLESTLFIEVEGLHDPFGHHQFEEKILKQNRSIKSLILTKISVKSSEYQIKSKHELDDLMDFFNRKNPDYYFITDKISSNHLFVEAFSRIPIQVSDLLEWDTDQRILKMITESLSENDDKEEGQPDAGKDLFQQSSTYSEFIPRFLEKEPNSNSRNLNRVPPQILVLGNISSRADEDVFQLVRNVESSTLVVEWMQIGKTTLSPQLRLYDDSFSFIKNYRLSPQKDKNRYLFTFNQSVPHKLYLRVTDKVGFIQGETGGFKSFYYLIKYYWETDKPSLNASLIGH
jgi:hypothetical protein